MKTIISCLSCLIIVAFIVTGKSSYAATYTITSAIDYGIVSSGSSVQPEVTIVNTGTAVLQTGNIADTNPVAAPFGIFSNPCVNVLIQPGEQCSFMVRFSPTAQGTYTDSLNVDIVSDNSTHVVNLTGQGGPTVDAPDIDVFQTSVDFGQVDVLNATTAATAPYTFTEYVQNVGNLDMTISPPTVGGTDASDISISGSCASGITLLGKSPTFGGGYCTITITFSPLTTGDKSASISIPSNDPDENPFVINVRAQVIGENDGVPTSVEDAAPNNGDGNNDGIPDSLQNNVASLVDEQGDYITYLTNQGTLIRNMALLTTNMTSIPGYLVNGPGLFDFTIEGLSIGQTVQLGIILPAGKIPSGYYLYGSTADNQTPHWYNFTYDSTTGTGASILGNTAFTTGAGFTRSVIYVTFQDGGLGDVDMKANGVITVNSGIAAPNNSSSNHIGSIGIFQILFMLLPIIFLRMLSSMLCTSNNEQRT